MENRKEQRETWTGRFVMILAILGGLIGPGDIWRFPYMIGTHGGAVYLIVFIIFLVGLGWIGFTIESTLGKRYQGGPITALERSGMPAGKPLGFLALFVVFVIVTYFMVVAGWFIKYFVASITGGLSTPDLPKYFMSFAFASPERFLFHFITVLVSAAIILLGVVKGLERTNKILVPLLFVCLVIMAIKGLSLPGASKGLSFLFSPDWSKLSGRVVLMALGQVFFTIGLSTTVLVLFGSYMKKQEDIPANTLIATIGDTFAALIAALAIFPTLFAFGMTKPEGGPALVFIIYPMVLKELPRVFSIIFFLGAVAVMISSTIFLLELFIEPLVSRYNWTRKKATWVVALVVYICGLPAAYNFNWLTHIDAYFTTILMPVMALLSPLALLWFGGKAKEEEALQWVNEGAKLRLGRWWIPASKYIYPILVALVVLMGILDLLKVW